MARVQVLRLPGSADSSAPFVLVFDQAPPELIDAFDRGDFRKLAKRAGARTCIVFEGTLDVA